MPIPIKLSAAERIRRAVAADPSLSSGDLVSRFGVSSGQVKVALAYKLGHKSSRRRA